MAEVKSGENILAYNTSKHLLVEPFIRIRLKDRGLDDAFIVNRYVVQLGENANKGVYLLEAGRKVYQLQVDRRGNKFLGYETDLTLSESKVEAWYEGDSGKGNQIESQFYFGEIEVSGEIKTAREGELLKIEGYKGDGFVVPVDRSDEMGDVLLKVDVLPEGARFKLLYSPG